MRRRKADDACVPRFVFDSLKDTGALRGKALGRERYVCLRGGDLGYFRQQSHQAGAALLTCRTTGKVLPLGFARAAFEAECDQPVIRQVILAQRHCARSSSVRSLRRARKR